MSTIALDQLFRREIPLALRTCAPRNVCLIASSIRRLVFVGFISFGMPKEREMFCDAQTITDVSPLGEILWYYP